MHDRSVAEIKEGRIMELNNLPKQKGIHGKSKRRGRGYGSGKGGHTTGTGTKGQKARGTGKVNPGYEGGQVPLYKKVPKLAGFRNPTSKNVIEFSVLRLNRFNDGDKVNPKVILEKRMVKKIGKASVKIISNGTLAKKLELSGFLYTKGAREAIEKSGSKIVE